MIRDQDDVMLVRFEEGLTSLALSSSTVVNYLTDLRTFLRWGKKEIGEEFSLLIVTQEHIRLYRDYLARGLKRAASTINRHLMALRKFFAIAQQMGLVAFDPTAGVALVKEDRQAGSRPISESETEKLLDSAERGTRAGLVRRDRAILLLLLHTGLRVSELVDLQKDDVVFNDPGVQLRVNGKDKDNARRLPLPGQVCKCLNDYLKVCPQSTTVNHLFLSQDGRPLSSRTVQRIISDCAKTAGLEGVSAQSLRRTFAVQLWEKTKDLKLVSQRLGHQNCAITEQYLAVHDNIEV
jgi:integrase/recombinase XerC